MRSKGKQVKYPPSHKNKSLQDSKFVQKQVILPYLESACARKNQLVLNMGTEIVILPLC